MKKTTICLALVGLLLSVGNVAAQELERLNKKKFNEKIWNFSKQKRFSYLGTAPIIVDFYADWCVPCKQIHPILVELQQEYEGKLTIYRVNTDKDESIANAFKIEKIPALVFMKPGVKKYFITTGKKTKEELKKIIDAYFFQEVEK